MAKWNRSQPTRQTWLTTKNSERKASFRSGLEERVADQLCQLDIEYQYEKVQLKYTLPAKTYTPDFSFPGNKTLIIETKGYFSGEDRTKHLNVRRQNPQFDIRFVFSNPKAKLNKSSKTSYADWCDKHGFKWAAKEIPMQWIRELKGQP